MLAGYNLPTLVIAEDLGTLESESLEKCSLRSQRAHYNIKKVSVEPNTKVAESLKQALSKIET